jgi:hypothetical protein
MSQQRHKKGEDRKDKITERMRGNVAVRTVSPTPRSFISRRNLRLGDRTFSPSSGSIGAK